MCGCLRGALSSSIRARTPISLSLTYLHQLHAVPGLVLICLLHSYLQFNERFLITIQEHAYSCQYGTFIGNCERQREDLNLRQKSYSLWGYIVSHNDEFVNPIYERSTNRDILRPNVVPQNIRFWRGLYCRFLTILLIQLN